LGLGFLVDDIMSGVCFMVCLNDVIGRSNELISWLKVLLDLSQKAWQHAPIKMLSTENPIPKWKKKFSIWTRRLAKSV